MVSWQLLAYRGLGSAAVGIHPGAPVGVLSLPLSTLKAVDGWEAVADYALDGALKPVATETAT